MQGSPVNDFCHLVPIEGWMINPAASPSLALSSRDLKVEGDDIHIAQVGPLVCQACPGGPLLCIKVAPGVAV